MTSALSYSSIIQTTSAKLLSSSSISTAVSVGIHGLVLLVLFPSLSGFSQTEKSTTPRNVGIIELTPAEQTRLPDLSGPSLNIPPSSLPNTPSADTSISNPAPLPTNIPNSLSSIPSTPPLPPLGYNNIPFSPINPPVWLNPPPSITPPPPPLNPPSNSNLSLPDNLSRPDNFAPPQNTLTDNDFRNASRKASEQRQREIEEADARRNSNSSSTGSSANEDSFREGEATNDNQISQNWLAFLQDTGTPIGKSEVTKLSIPGSYSKLAYDRKLEGTAIYAVLVNTEGTIANTRLIRSSRYKILDQQALQQIQSRRFRNQSGKPKVYTIDVTYKLNTPSPEPTQNNNTQQPSPGNNPPTETQSSPQTPEGSTQNSTGREQDTNKTNQSSESPNSQSTTEDSQSSDPSADTSQPSEREASPQTQNETTEN